MRKKAMKRRQDVGDAYSVSIFISIHISEGYCAKYRASLFASIVQKFLQYDEVADEGFRAFPLRKTIVLA